MKKILLPGDLGEIGSQIALELNRAGYKVYCLIRSKSKVSAKERLEHFLNQDYEVVEGYITQHLCGLTSDKVRSLKGFEKFIHCAALVKFDKTLANELHLTNEIGTQNVIRLAKTLAIPEMHFVSTAYVAGKAEQFNELETGKAENARNPYELTKQKAEELVIGCGIPFNIYRLSVVVGDSKTCEINSFNGYYGYFSSLWVIQAKLRELATEATFQLPVNLKGAINLVPRDWIREMLGKHIVKGAKNHCFHLLHPKPSNVAWALQESYRHLNLPIRPTEIYLSLNTASKSWSAIQRMIIRESKTYAPYTDHEAQFGFALLKETLGSDFKNPTPINQEYLGKILDYAIQQNFGRQNVSR